VTPGQPYIVGQAQRTYVPTDVLEGRLERADVPGRHLWVITGMWLIADPSQRENVQLDSENLLTVQGPGCFKCEQPYSRQLARRPCRGSLS
jgi:hypothetical protein